MVPTYAHINMDGTIPHQFLRVHKQHLKLDLGSPFQWKKLDPAQGATLPLSFFTSGVKLTCLASTSSRLLHATLCLRLHPLKLVLHGKLPDF